MNAWLRHRGPDGEGAWSHSAGHVGLAHRRLSIIDSFGDGRQRMIDAAGNWITFDDELYNWSLRRQVPHRLCASSLLVVTRC
jgi:asparagine synthase (glutamine-hydrolysing)